MSKYSIFRRRRPGALLLDSRTFKVRFLSEGFDPIFHKRKARKMRISRVAHVAERYFSRRKTRKMRISRVAHVAERYFSQGKPRKIWISTIADVTEPHFSLARTRKIEFQWLLTSPSLGFSRAREPNPYPGVAEPYLEPLPQKSKKNPGPKKRQFLVYFYVNIFNFSSPAPRSTFVGFSDV